MTPKERAEARARAARAQLLTVAAGGRPVWHVRENGLAALAAQLSGAAEFTAFWWEDDEEEADGPAYQVTADGVAVIPIQGMLLDSEPTWWMKYLGYASTPQIRDMVREAADDANVSSILLLVDSPGGQASGIADAAQAIYDVRLAGEKKIVAACKDACSAAYWLASQAERVFVLVDGDAGCIGTLVTVRDWSQFYAEMGIVVSTVTSDGAETYKGMLTPGTEITPKHKEELKRLANAHQTLFNAGLVQGRGWTPEKALEMADGRWHIGQDAVDLGLADRILSTEDALTLLGSGADLDSIDEGTDPPPGDTPAEDDTEPTTTSTTGAASRAQERKTMSVLNLGRRPAAAPTAAAPPAEVTETADNAALNAAERTELNQLRSWHETALNAAKATAKAAAVTAFGQNSPLLLEAEAEIEATQNPGTVALLAKAYQRLTPPTLSQSAGGAEPQTTAPVSGTSDTENKDDKTFFDNIREEGQRKNGTAPVAAGR
jgi:ClpP class serine protease